MSVISGVLKLNLQIVVQTLKKYYDNAYKDQNEEGRFRLDQLDQHREGRFRQDKLNQRGKGRSCYLKWLEVISFWFMALTPVLGIGTFSSDIYYIFSQKEDLRQTLTLGLFLMAFFLVPVFMIPYWTKQLLEILQPCQIIQKIMKKIYQYCCCCCQDFENRLKQCCHQILVIIVLIILNLILFIPIFLLVIVIFILILVAMLIVLTFTKLDIWLLWIDAYDNKKTQGTFNVVLSFRNNFEFIKDLLCIYIHIVVSSYLLRWTPVTIVLVIFRWLLIIKTIIYILMELKQQEATTHKGEQTQVYAKILQLLIRQKSKTGNQNERVKYYLKYYQLDKPHKDFINSCIQITKPVKDVEQFKRLILTKDQWVLFFYNDQSNECKQFWLMLSTMTSLNVIKIKESNQQLSLSIFGYIYSSNGLSLVFIDENRKRSQKHFISQSNFSELWEKLYVKQTKQWDFSTEITWTKLKQAIFQINKIKSDTWKQLPIFKNQ